MTNDTANENFMTDHGSIRLTCSRARRGPRPTAAETVLRALRTASVTLAEPEAPLGPPDTVPVEPPGRTPRVPVADAPPEGTRTLARATAGEPPGTDPTPAPLEGIAAGGPEVGACSGTVSESGGGDIPGGLVNLGESPPGTVARPTALSAPLPAAP